MTISKRLYILRHAKASPGEGSTADHDRPLAPSGLDQATLMGQHIARRLGAPDLIVCSTALRAMETARLVAAELTPRPPIDHDRGLYVCGADALLRRIHALDPELGSIMIVAHNPDLHELAFTLAATGSDQQMAALRRKFPTGALAVLTFDVPTWSAVQIGQGRLDEFTVANELM